MSEASAKKIERENRLVTDEKLDTEIGKIDAVREGVGGEGGYHELQD